MTFNFICPDFYPQRYFNTNFSITLIDYIFDHWTTTTGMIAKPSTRAGQSNTIDFRAGIIDDNKQLQVTVLQGLTRIGQPNGSSGYLQVGQKAYSMLTQMQVTLKAESPVMGDTSDRLRIMEQELLNICGTYKQQSDTVPTKDIYGIKDLVYDTGERIYLPEDEFDKSDWRSIHSIWLWYELADNSS
jgi:hypothetical protein